MTYAEKRDCTPSRATLRLARILCWEVRTALAFYRNIEGDREGHCRRHGLHNVEQTGIHADGTGADKDVNSMPVSEREASYVLPKAKKFLSDQEMVGELLYTPPFLPNVGIVHQPTQMSACRVSCLLEWKGKQHACFHNKPPDEDKCT